jgi:MraZ protein
MLIGQFTHDLDPKKRLTLPAKWRSSLGKKVVITNGLDTSLFVFPLKEWEIIAEKLASMSFGNADSRQFNRFMLAHAFETDIDAQGRILIPDTLKSFAHLNGKVVVAGMHSRIELWDEEEWKRYTEKTLHEADALAGKLSDLGIL